MPNRTSVQVGAGSAVTTSFNNANRPTSDSAGGTYTSDDDGGLTARPGYRYEWDHLGRLTKVKPPTGGSVIATYTYDPLDRLRMADYGGSTRTRFRYVGLTTSVAQTIDDQTGTVIRHFGNGWTGERLLDWTGSGSNIRIYGENAHHDVTWTASTSGAVTATLRYDPWGTLTASTGSSLPDHRFQGSWYDTTTEISWVVTRWYAPALGRFLSEDSLLGEPIEPDSRHLYAYTEGEPIARWDPDGRFWYKVRYGDRVSRLAVKYLGRVNKSPRILLANKYRIKTYRSLRTGQCIWIPNWGRNNGCVGPKLNDRCPYPTPRPGFDPADPTKTPVPWCPKVDEPSRAMDFEVHTVGLCQPKQATWLLLGASGSVCAILTDTGKRAVTATLGAGLSGGASLTGGLTYMFSNGRVPHDQDAWFDVNGASASYVLGGVFEISSGTGTRGQRVKTIQFGVTGGVGVRVSVGKSFTWVFDDQRTFDMITPTFPMNPWTTLKQMMPMRYEYKRWLRGY